MSEDATSPRRKHLYRLGLWTIVIVGLLGLFLLFAPNLIVRYLVASELDALGVEHDGVDTIKINLFERSLWMGPVRFGEGPDDPGQLGELGLVLRFTPLAKSRVSIERLLVRDIELQLTRDPQGLALHGIQLQGLTPDPALPEPATTDESAWGIGVDTLELQDSRLIFTNLEGGTLDVEVERLELTDLQTWSPERPARFDLAAALNDIKLNWKGEARPFADDITLAIDSVTEQADVPKLVRFTGPWGLDRRDGTYDADLEYEMTLYGSGRLEGRAVGAIDIQNADYQREDVFALASRNARIDLDLRFSLSGSDHFTLAGKLDADLAGSSAQFGAETRLAAGSGQLRLSDIEASYAQDGTLAIELQPDATLEGVDFSGPIEISVSKLLELLTLLQSLSAGTGVDLAATGFGDYADNSLTVPSSDVEIGSLQVDGETVSLRSNDGEVELALEGKLDLSEIGIVANDKLLDIKRLQSVVERLALTAGAGRLAFQTTGSNRVTRLDGTAPLGEVRLGVLEANVKDLDIGTQQGMVAIKTAATARAADFAGRVSATADLAAVDIGLGTLDATLAEASLESSGGGLRWAAAIDASMEDLDTRFADAKSGKVALQRAKIGALRTDERLRLVAERVAVDSLDLYLTRSLINALLGREPASTPKTAATPGRAAAPAPAGPDRVRRAQTLLSELGYDPGAIDGLMGPRTVAAIRSFQGAEGLSADGRLTDRLLAALAARASGSTDTPAATPARTAADGSAGGRVRVTEVALTGNPRIRFRDDVITPPVTIATVFDEAWVRNLDTQRSDQRTELRLVAKINEFTRAEVAGWFTGLGDSADLDVTAKIDNLELATYSPYLAALAGAAVESGRLDMQTVGRADKGELQGDIQLLIDNIEFQPLSDEDAERLAGTVGMPVTTAVALLQDDDGEIALTLPIHGKLSSPQVDVAPAVNKAIGGAFRAVFPPTMVMSLLSDVTKDTGAGLEPIQFAPGSTDLDAGARRYADSMAKLLAERPKLKVKVCGRATARDMAHLTGTAIEVAPEESDSKDDLTGDVTETSDDRESAELLKGLAIERGRTVRRYMIDDLGVDVKQLPECGANFSADDQGEPRAEIKL